MAWSLTGDFRRRIKAGFWCASQFSAFFMEKERSYFTNFELRATLDADRRPIIEGHAAVFNQPSLEIFPFAPGWREIIRPGAFSKAIQSDDVAALVNHDESRLIGRKSNGTLALEEDEIGLKVRIFPPDTADGRDAVTLVRGKYFRGMSFGFLVSEQGQFRNDSDKLREILEVKALYDVSPVTFPAYPKTDVGLRSFFEASKQIKPDALEKAEFRRRMKAREELMNRWAPKLPQPNKNDLSEIIKRCRQSS